MPGIRTKCNSISTKWARFRYKCRKPFAEFFGTAVMIAFGCGAVAQKVFSENNSWFTVSLAWGLGLIAAIYVAGGVSGAHFNPAVTLALAIFRGFPWAEVPVYWVAQLTGAFFGALIVFIGNLSALRAADRSTTVGIFFTGRQTAEVTTADAFIFEVIATALLLIIILATSDKGNNPAGNLQPLIIGLSITLIGTSYGYQTGYALNPARDLGPRFFTALFGWGFGVFSRQDYYFWVPIVGPVLGAIIGCCFYDFFIHSSERSPDVADDLS
ncbi:glycerol channel [Linnemannia gamsii]|uniref:Glycerol channel n=1 Tax=Linnemannia gamsii TaxID=64522 RepID=A0ABQ7JJF2_9FUNG|nr:glycerol channel [Linnemannia gamsii]